MLTWNANRSPVRAHFRFQGNMATFYSAQYTTPRPRARVVRTAGAAPPGRPIGHRLGATSASRASWRLFYSAEYRTPTRARARTRSVRCAIWPTSEKRMLTWKSNRPPLRAHFSFQGTIAFFLVCAIQSSPPARARARVRAANAAPPGRHLTTNNAV